MLRSLKVVMSASNAWRKAWPLGGDDGSEGGTKLLTFALTSLVDCALALLGLGARGGHGMGGIEEVAEGVEALGGGAGAVQFDLAEDASLEGFGIERGHQTHCTAPAMA